jgi:maltose O-acetyltransferase
MIVNYLKDIIRRFIGEVPTKVLIKRGLSVGVNFNRQQGCFIDPTHCWLIEIGNNVTMSIKVVLLAHDASSKNLIGYTNKDLSLTQKNEMKQKLEDTDGFII